MSTTTKCVATYVFTQMYTYWESHAARRGRGSKGMRLNQRKWQFPQLLNVTVNMCAFEFEFNVN